jgi:hypothetical protein
MPPDYIEFPKNNYTRSLANGPPTSGAPAVAWMAQMVYAQAVAAAERFKKSIQDWRERDQTLAKQATGNNVATRPVPPKKNITPLEVEVNAIIRRYESQLHKVPDLATALKVPAENFLGLTDDATGGRRPDYAYLVRIDPRSFDFANLLIFAADRGFGFEAPTIGELGVHGELSFHYDGRAIDIHSLGLSPERLDYIRSEFASVGVRCYDETIKKNHTKKTTADHLHFDTATQSEINQRSKLSKQDGTRIQLGIGEDWPARQP